MTARVQCECGFVLEGTDADLVDAAQHHARRVHGMEVAASLVLSLARPVHGDHTRDEEQTG